MRDLRWWRQWCEQCQEYGHAKWLFLGTHRTHRWYIRWKVRRVIRKEET